MKTVVYDGSFEGFLCAVFDVYEYKINEPEIVPLRKHQPSMFAGPHFVNHNLRHSNRVWKALEKKLTLTAQKSVYLAFLSEQDGIENKLLQYFQQALAAEKFMEDDVHNPIAQSVIQAAKKARREKKRTEDFVRFQETKNNLHYALIEPACNVLPLIAKEFRKSYNDRRWMIYDAERRYGFYYNGRQVQKVQAKFSQDADSQKDAIAIFDEGEALYLQLWKKYFKSGTILGKAKTKLYVQPMPARQHNFADQQPHLGLSLQDRLTNWTYKRA